MSSSPAPTGPAALLALLAALAGCGDQGSRTAAAPKAAAPAPVSAPPVAPEAVLPTKLEVTEAAAKAPLPAPTFEAALPGALRGHLFEPYKGDLDGMIKRRLIRIGVPYSRTYYFVDEGVQRGVSYEMGRAFENELNRKLGTNPGSHVHVAFITVPRDQLGQALIDGRIDLISAQVTIRPELKSQVDFSTPTRRNVNEVVVTGPGAPAIATVDDLSGREVWTRKGGKYEASLLTLNKQLKAKGQKPVLIRHAPGNLEDEDLLEMVSAGLIPIVVVDNYLADFWAKTFPELTVHDDVALRTGGELAVVMRKNSPKLMAATDAFVGKYGLGTAFGNTIEKRYLESTRYAKSATSEADRQRFLDLVQMFRKYSDEYKVDYLMMAAQGYQESGLNQNAKSSVGAVGIMQLMPATGREQQVGDITQVDPNIHAGVKYMRFMMDRYYKDEPMDELNKALFTFASYNAGPARIAQLRREAEARGLNPIVWFGNVEQIASERIGRETVTYVSNIYKYYIAYRLVLEQTSRRDATKQAMKAQVASR